MEMEPLIFKGDGPYNYEFRLEGIPHFRGGRSTELEDELYRSVFAEIHGGSMQGSSGRENDHSFEFVVYAPDGVEDIEGDSVVLATLEFHSVQMTYARGSRVSMTGFLTGVNAYPADAYPQLEGLKTQEEFEAVDAITNAVGRLKYLPPVYAPAQQFMGWKFGITMVPVKH